MTCVTYPGVIPINDLYGKAPSRRGIFFQACQVYERVGISLDKVYERSGESVSSV